MRSVALVTILFDVDVDVDFDFGVVDVEVYACQRPVDLNLSRMKTPMKVRGMNILWGIH